MSPIRFAPALLLVATGMLGATETENLDLKILPAPGPVAIDAEIKDWDLSGGIFACGDVENQRDKYGVWIHTMWDAENLYILARWNDLTPMNHPGSIKGDYGFSGDCLQVRVLTAPADKLMAASVRGSPNQDQGGDQPGTRTSHITAWRDRDGLDTVKIDWGQKFNEGGVEAKDKGGKQAFKMWDDKRGYTQEMSIPWSQLSRDGWKPAAGAKIVVTFEPNFLTGANSRLTIKDIFRAGTGIDRVFTFQAPNCWGFATLESKGKVELRPVRLSDSREFPVKMADGLPMVDWAGLVKSREPEGFKPIRFKLDEDGNVSLNLFRADGTVARQLLANAFYTKGDHEVVWDGLTTMSIRVPGQPVEPGEYTWAGIVHPPISLTLRGWAGSTSTTPWGNVWGSDHGDPCAVATDGEQVYVGWAGGEGAKPLLACTPDGKIQWKQIRGGIATASVLAADNGTVYVWNEFGQYAPRSLYRVAAKDGSYNVWTRNGGTDLSLPEVFAAEVKVNEAEKDPAKKSKIPDAPGSLCAGKGKVFMGFGELNQVVVLDGTSGNVVKRLAIPGVGDIELGADGRLYAVAYYDKVVNIVAVDVDSGAVTRIGSLKLDEGDWVRALAVDKDGDLYCGITGNHHYIEVMDKAGKLTRSIGPKQGRKLSGTWDPNGLLQISALAIDAKGQLWATEQDGQPRRTSVWNAKTGAFIAEYFGSSTYGAMGSCIDPNDPSLMVGQGVEWKLDAKTGMAQPLGTITRTGMMNARYGKGSDGRLYLATSPSGGCGGADAIRFFEKIKDGEWKLRSLIAPYEKDKVKLIKSWADANDDQVEQPDEVKTYPDEFGGWIQGWFMAMTSDLSGYGGMKRIKVTGWTSCHAPIYDFSKAETLPACEGAGYRGGMGAQHNAGSDDNRFVLWNGSYGEDHSTFECFDIASGKRMWTYPNNFTGVHGSHRACAPEVGMIRGAFDICGAATLPEPIGNIWIIPTNKGEWHVLTEKGYYLTNIWEGDSMKMEFPDKAAPGADCTRCPPGAGEEAFGGSITRNLKTGEISLQGGHTSFWNVTLGGLEKTKALAGGKVSITAADVETAKQYRQSYLNMEAGGHKLVVTKATPAFTGDLAKDFGAKTVKSFARQENAKIKTALAWDDANLYAGWQVADDTPWINGADASEFMYARGDTVDLQLGTNLAAHDNAELGDLRLSIGPFQGKPTAEVYRRVVAKESDKKPMKFVSGVYRDGKWMDSVIVATGVKISVKVADDKKSYVVEAAIPWSLIGATPKEGLVLKGDFGATHGSKAGNDTVLRSYWSNAATGIVSDEVEELFVVPNAWGDLTLGK